MIEAPAFASKLLRLREISIANVDFSSRSTLGQAHKTARHRRNRSTRRDQRMTCSLLSTAIRKACTGRALTLALPIVHGLCLAPPVLAIGAYAPGHEPDKLPLR